MTVRKIIAKNRRRTKLILNTRKFWNFLFLQIRSGQNLPGICKVLNVSYNATIKQINSSISLRKRYEKAKSKQDKRIKHKWSVIESTILSDHREAEKTLIRFHNWLNKGST